MFVFNCRAIFLIFCGFVHSHNSFTSGEGGTISIKGNYSSGAPHTNRRYRPGVILEAKFVPPNINEFQNVKDQNWTWDTLPQDFSEFKLWKQPRLRRRKFGVNSFLTLLPSKSKAYEVGEVYEVLSVTRAGNPLSSGVYNPPAPLGDAAKTLYTIFSMFHANAFVYSRFVPRGAVGIVRAVRGTILDIALRLHVEFQLNRRPQGQFWFTPGQFQGRLIIDTKERTIHYLRAEVPTKRVLNLDIEWLSFSNDENGKLSPEANVDIGFIANMSITYGEQQWSDQNWDQELDIEIAQRKMEQFMYPFQKIQYLPLELAVKESNEKQLPIHVVALWGALDDQSC